MGITEVPEVLAHIPNLVDARRRQEDDDLQLIQSEIQKNLLGDFEESELEDIQNRVYISKPFYNRAHLVKSLAQKKSVYEFNSKDFASLRGQFDEITHVITDWKQRQD